MKSNEDKEKHGYIITVYRGVKDSEKIEVKKIGQVTVEYKVIYSKI